MRFKKYFVIILFVFLVIGCSSKGSVMVEQTPISQKEELIKYIILIEGLESAYYSSVINTITSMDAYVRHTIILSKDGIFEGTFRFKDEKSVSTELVSRLNSVFMAISKAADIRETPGALKIIITEW